MTDTNALRKVVNGVLREYGLTRAGRRWVLVSDETTWTVGLDTLPYGGRHRLELDLSLAALAADDGPDAGIPALGLVQEQFEQLAGVDTRELQRAMDLHEPVDDETRLETVTRFTHVLAGYAQDHRTFDAVKRAYAAGDFQAGFVYWKARELLGEPG